MKKITTVLFVFILIVESVYAQVEEKHNNWIWGPSIGYQYQKKNFLKTSIWGLTDLGYANYLRFDAGVDLTWHSSKAHIIPELGATYYLSAKGVWPFLKVEATPYSLTPKVGVGLFNIVEIGAGYGFDIKMKEGLVPIKGFSFSVGLSLPLNYHLY